MGLVLAALLGAVALTLALLAGQRLTAPCPFEVGGPPVDSGWLSVAFPDEAGRVVRGWYAAGDEGRGAVPLCHGLRESRLQMLGRGHWLRGRGASVLLIDLYGHGESDGDAVSFGARESASARGAVAWLREQRPTERVAAIGFSLGGAACLLGPRPLDVDALVLEATYSTIRSAVQKRMRMRLGAVGGFAAPLLLWQLSPRLGVAPAELRPLVAIQHLQCPVFVIGGARDERVPASETRALYEAAPYPKALWIMESARHEHLHEHSPEAYEERVARFLDPLLVR